jgi:hypothetical protein
MVRILTKKSVRFPCLTSNVAWQFCEHLTKAPRRL